MVNIFWGAFFSLLDFNLYIGNVTIGLIPDFIGYLLILKGLRELRVYSHHFDQMRVPAMTMMIVSAIVYALNLLGLTDLLGVAAILIISVAGIAIDLYLYYHLALGVKDIENQKQVFLNADGLMKMWYLLILAYAASLFVSLSPAIMVLMIVAAFILIIIFLITLNQTKNLYVRSLHTDDPPISYNVGPKIEEEDESKQDPSTEE